MKYMVIGAGGTGGCIAGHMAQAGFDVQLIARGEHLEAIKTGGLIIDRAWDGSRTTAHLEASDAESCRTFGPDCIFLCVKGYSVDGIMPFLKETVRPGCVVIPVLNIVGAGGRIQPQLPKALVADGCIYVSANITKPGKILMHGSILRVVFGSRDGDKFPPVLVRIRDDLEKCGIEALLSDNIRRDAMQKFAYVSPMAACGLYYGAEAGAMQRPGEERDMFAGMTSEIVGIAAAMGIEFDTDLTALNLDILDKLTPTASTSMQRDIKAGHKSEIDGIVYEVVRLSENSGVPAPLYKKAAAKFMAMGLK